MERNRARERLAKFPSKSGEKVAVGRKAGSSAEDRGVKLSALSSRAPGQRNILGDFRVGATHLGNLQEFDPIKMNWRFTDSG